MSVTLRAEAGGAPQLNKAVLALYVLIVLVLGALGAYSLYLGKDYVTFTSSIVTALTTIAGFAVGANVTK
jgi:hypothetical protein